MRRASLALLVAAAAVAAGAASAGYYAGWPDPVGDVAGPDPAPDMRSVEVTESLDLVFVTVRFDASGPRYSSSEAPRHVDMVSVLLDIDRNGKPSEDDFLAGHTAPVPNDGVLELLGPPGSEPKWRRRLSASGNGTSVTLALPKILLANPAVVRLAAGVVREYPGAEGRGGADACPDAGTYLVPLTPLPLKGLRLPDAAKRPRAGRLLALSGIRGLTANGKRVTLTRVIAKAAIGGKALRPVAKGAVSWRVPASARGKTVVVKVTGRFGAASKTTTWRLRVR